MNNVNNMDDMKKEVKKTAKKAKYMAQEVAEDVKDNVEDAMMMMENKKDEVVDRYEQRKFINEAEQKANRDLK